jgi:hypothetical protein
MMQASQYRSIESRSCAPTCVIQPRSRRRARADAVVNAVSAYVEEGDVTFEAVHEQGAQTVAREATAGVARLEL